MTNLKSIRVSRLEATEVVARACRNMSRRRDQRQPYFGMTTVIPPSSDETSGRDHPPPASCDHIDDADAVLDEKLVTF